MYMKWITTFESSNTYSVLRLITSENETRNVHLQGHKNQNVIIHNYKLGLIEVKHIFFNWCGVPNETLRKFSLAILHNLVNSQTLQSASKTCFSRIWMVQQKQKEKKNKDMNCISIYLLQLQQQ